MTESKLGDLVAGVSQGHCLKRGGPSYLARFVKAFVAVYPPLKRARILQAKFFIPDERRYTDDAFYASASELCVANHIRQQTNIRDFSVDRRLNRHSRKDVDVWFRVGATEVAMEVKCPIEIQPRGVEPGRINVVGSRYSGQSASA
jgi:hypothetical protein